MITKALLALSLAASPVISTTIARPRNLAPGVIDDFSAVFSDDIKDHNGEYLKLEDFDLTPEETSYILSSSTNGVPMSLELITASDSDYAGVENGYYDSFAKYVSRITGWTVNHQNITSNSGSDSWVQFMHNLEATYASIYQTSSLCPGLTDTPTTPLDDPDENGTPDPSYLGYDGMTSCLEHYITTTYGNHNSDKFVMVNADKNLRDSGLLNSYFVSNGETYHDISIYNSFDEYDVDKSNNNLWVDAERVYTLSNYGIKDQLAEKYNITHPNLTSTQAKAKITEFDDIESLLRAYFKKDINRDEESILFALSSTVSDYVFRSFDGRIITNNNSPYKGSQSSQIIAPTETQFEFSYRTSTFGNDGDASSIVSKIFRHKKTRHALSRFQNNLKKYQGSERLKLIPVQERNALQWLVDNNLINFVIPTSSSYNNKTTDFYEGARNVIQKLYTDITQRPTDITKTKYVSNEDYEKYVFGLNRTFMISDIGLTYGREIDMINIYTAANDSLTVFKKTSYETDSSSSSIFNNPIVVDENSNLHIKLLEIKDLYQDYANNIIRANVSRTEKKRWLAKNNIILAESEEEMFELVNTHPEYNVGVSTLSIVEKNTTSGEYVFTERIGNIGEATLSVYVPKPMNLDGGTTVNGFSQWDLLDYTPDATKTLIASTGGAYAVNEYIFVSNLLSKVFSVSDLHDKIIGISANANGLEKLSNSNTILLWSSVIALCLVSAIVALSIKPFIQSSIKLAKRSEIARKDILTGIKNRFSLVAHDVVELQKYAEKVTIVFIDLDKFKEINDTRGHAVGDRVLQVVAKRLQKYADSGYTPFRIGGDEFVVLVSNKNKEDVEEYANHIMQEIKRPIVFSDFVIHPEGSVGIAEGNIKEKDIDQILSEADLSLYNVKRTGKVGWHDDGHIEWVNMIKENLLDSETKGFVTPYFQPIVYKDGSIASAEALFRSVNPDINRNLGKFFGTIDKLNWFDVVDLKMAEAVFSEIRRKFWAENKSGKIAFSLNVHPYTLLKVSNYAEYIDELAERYSLNRNFITIEVTEFAIEDQKLMDQIKEIKSKGFMIAIDDFSAGHSSLGRISLFKNLVDMIKIDQGVILNQPVSMAKSVIKFVESISSELGATVVVEGVEVKDYLIGAPKTKYQGYYFSKPIPVNELEEAKNYKTADWLKKTKRIQEMYKKQKKTEEKASSDFKPAMPGKR